MDLRDPHDVIQMGVGEPDGRNPPPVLFRSGEECPGSFSGIDEDGVGALRIENEIAVLGELPVGKRNDFGGNR
jgi:hypothetical protein